MTDLSSGTITALLDRLKQPLRHLSVHTMYDRQEADRRDAHDAITALQARVEELEGALRPFAKHADGRRKKGIDGSICFSQVHLLQARAALSEQEGRG